MKWTIRPQAELLADTISASSIVLQALVHRGISAEEAPSFLLPSLYVPTSPYEHPDMQKAVERLQKAILSHETILIWGDFDVDGQTSTALLVEGLTDLGANIRYHIPNRFTEGHGIKVDKLTSILNDGVGVLLTCDTGISAHEAIEVAQNFGVDVIITDHHALPDQLPKAFAIINPMLLPENHPQHELSGVGVAFLLIQALYGTRSCDHLLDLVAVGMVADVMLLVKDTRYWVQRGLFILQHSPRLAFQEIMKRATIQPENVTETDIGFSIAPRLNALGRLSDATPAVKFLTTKDIAFVMDWATELESLNQKRRFLTRQVYEASKATLTQDVALLKYSALVVSGEGWHTGVVGIVASKLAEEYQRPTVVLSEEGAFASGSARSINGYDLIQAIRSQESLLIGFGGHRMAGGVRLHRDQIFAFRRGLSQAIREQHAEKPHDDEAILWIDAIIPFSAITLELAEEIAQLAPFGNGNAPLILVTQNVRVHSRKTLGSRGDHLDLRLVDESGTEQRILWWFGNIEAVPTGVFDVAYTIRPNVFKGQRGIMVEWIGSRVHKEQMLVSYAPSYSVIDYRDHHNKEKLWQDLHINELSEYIVWREGQGKHHGVNRYQLSPGKTLVVWSIPPSVTTWKAILQIVQPEQVLLVGMRHSLDHLESLLKTLIGMIKYAYTHKNGFISVTDMVVFTIQREETIHLAVQWINASTPYFLEQVSEEGYAIQLRDMAPIQSETHPLLIRINRLLSETYHYRQNWLTQKVD